MSSPALKTADKRIALTGGIATGKTTVANRLRELGAIILDADEYARRAAEPGTSCYGSLRKLVGARYFNPDGTLKRAELRRQIIRDPALREGVNAVIHPYIANAMREEWNRRKKLDAETVMVFDVPLLFEGGFEGNYDIIILAYCTREVQVKRLMQRDGLPLREAERTLSMQLPIDSKKDRSDYIIENSGELEATLRQVDDLWSTLSQQ